MSEPLNAVEIAELIDRLVQCNKDGKPMDADLESLAEQARKELVSPPTEVELARMALFTNRRNERLMEQAGRG